MQNETTPAEGDDSAQLEAKSALRDAACSPSLMIDRLMREHKAHPTVYAADRAVKQLLIEAAATMAKLHNDLQEATEIARRSMETVMQIYGHAQFCDECQSFEIADSCRIQMHGMDRINSLENVKELATPLRGDAETEVKS